jgi:hypothetical protein
MASNLYATFVDSAQAEKAAGALLDYGVRKEDLSLVTNNDRFNYDDDDDTVADHSGETERDAKTGISTTTAEDAGVGAAKGAGLGLAVGIVAGLASIFVPGFGLVYGGGALASAIGAAVATTAAGAVAGGVTGYLKDQGVEETVANLYNQNLRNGGALLQVDLAGGNVDSVTAAGIVAKYGGSNLNVY